MKLSEEIEQQLEKRSLSPRAASLQMGFSKNSMGRWLATNSFHPEQLKKICSFFNLPEDLDELSQHYMFEVRRHTLPDKPRISHPTPEPSLEYDSEDVSEMIRKIPDDYQGSVTINDLRSLLKTQSTIPFPMSSELVLGFLQHNHSQ